MQNKINESKYHLTPLQEEASTRRYFLAKDEEGKEFTLCKDSNGVNRDFLELSGYFRSNGIRTPGVISYDFQSGIILQEFCGFKDLSHFSESDFAKYFDKVLDILVKLQTLAPHPIILSRRFDYEKLNWEIDYTFTALEKWKSELSWDIYTTEELKIFFQEVCNYLDDHPDVVIAHRDFHCRNIMFHNGELVLIDFQDARMGTPQYDLASILYDAYRPLSQEDRIEYLDIFIKKSNKKFVKFKETFYLQAIQRSFKALGTYLVQVGEKKNDKFKPSLFSCLENIKEICQMGHLPDSVYIFADSFLRYKNQL